MNDPSHPGYPGEYGAADLARALADLDGGAASRTRKLDLLEGVKQWYAARGEDAPEWWGDLHQQVEKGRL